ncbi:MAG TPA: extracellular solute-binding protein [Candidatus Limnocylindrales bacterium]|nr:extracellular solute-binding protein [Candidatus Limnocylindrales bacterium]
MNGNESTVRWRWARIPALLATVALVGAACGGGSSSSPTGTGTSPTDGPSATPGEPVEIEWFVGLGTGTNPEQIPVQEAEVAAFNASHPNIVLKLTVVDSEEAEQNLATRLPTDPPDIIGPIGIRGLQGYGDNLLDLTSYIESAGVDRAAVEDALWDVYLLDGKQIGIPMAVYPSFIYYNKALFDEADLPYPPHEVGEQYDGKDWTWATLRELALELTVDANGNNAASADFDPSAIEAWGLDAQFTNNDPRAWSTIFGGSGSIVADDGTTAQWPDNWRDGLQFFYDAMWTDHIVPTKPELDAIEPNGNSFQTGRIAMDVVHQWYTCCIYPAEGTPPVEDWDIAVLPEGPDGTITSKLHADTVGILDTTENPDAAFEVLDWIRQNPALLEAWGALPAVVAQRDAFFSVLDERFAPVEVDWNVSTLMLGYPDVPSHEAYMPNFSEANAANGEFGSVLWTTPGLDLQAEIDEHVERIQGIFDEAE